MKNTKSRVIDHTVKNHHCNLLHFTLAPAGLTPETQVGHFFFFFACSSSFGTRRQIKKQRFPSPVSGMFRRSHPSAARPEQAGPPRAAAPRPRPSGRGEATPRPSRRFDWGGGFCVRAAAPWYGTKAPQRLLRSCVFTRRGRSQPAVPSCDQTCSTLHGGLCDVCGLDRAFQRRSPPAPGERRGDLACVNRHTCNLGDVPCRQPVIFS